MRDDVARLAGPSRIYAVLGDPVAQVQTPTLVNPLFARRGIDIHAVPFHVPAAALETAWRAFASMPNIAGIGVTVPHKIAAARLCDHLTPAAAEVGAVNSVQRRADGTMHGALFDGPGFVRGLGSRRDRLRGASVLLVGAGGAGRAIAHALVAEQIGGLAVIDLDAAARDFTVDMVNRVGGRTIAKAGDGADGLAGVDVLVNASPVGLKSGDAFPVALDGLHAGMLVADIAALARETELLARARRQRAATSDGRDMLEAQIALIAGFAAGQAPGTSL